MLRSDQKCEIAYPQIYPSIPLLYATMQTAVLRDGILLCDECEAFLPKLDGEVLEIVGKVCDNKQQHTFDVPCASRIAKRTTTKDMEREREDRGLLFDQLIKRLVQHDFLHGGIPLKRFALPTREEERGGSELRHIGRSWIVHYDLPLRESEVNSEAEKDLLWIRFSSRSVMVQSQSIPMMHS